MADIDGVESWDTDPNNNTNIGGVPLGEFAMYPPHVNNAFRTLMAQVATFLNGFMGREIHEAPAKDVPVAADEFGYWDSVSGLLRKVTFDKLQSMWGSQPIGVPIPVFDHIAGLAPPTDQTYRYIQLTAGLTDAGEYNVGLLTSESVSSSAPAVQATAVVNSVGSLLHGATVRLINTERRFLRAGNAGTVEADTLASHPHTASFVGDPVPNHTHTFLGDQFDSDDNSGTGYGGAPTTRTTNPSGGHTPAGTVTVNAAGDTETRGKNIGATYYMRIK